MPKFKCLYFFTSPALLLIEIKRLDRPPESPPGEVYKWIVINRKSKDVIPLEFESMSKDETHEFRAFSSGALQFDGEKAQFFFAGTEHKLMNENSKELPQDMRELIQKVLKV